MTADATHRRRGRGRLAVAALAVLAAAAGGCGPKEQAPPRTRLLGDEPVALYSDDAVASTSTVYAWRRGDPPPDWLAGSLKPSGAWSLGRKGVARRRLESDATTLDLPWQIDAADLDEIAVTVSGLHRGQIDLAWRVGGETPDRPHRLRASQPPADRRRAVRRTFLLALDGASSWQGRIESLRLEIQHAPGSRLHIEEIEARSYAVSAERLERAVGRTWKVDVGKEVRNAWLAPPGLEIRREIQRTRGAHLRLAYGLTGRPAGPVTFRVAAPEAAAGTLFEETVDPAAAVSWKTADVDLSPLGGKDATIVFQTEAVGDFDARAMPAWAEPVVLRPQARAASAEGRLPDVVLISIDTLRADHLSLYGYERPTSPRLDAWAQRAVVFENAVTQSPWTLPAHVSMFTGLDTLTHGANHSNSVAAPHLETLAERLRAAGYWSVATTGSGYMHPQFGFAQGFDVYRFGDTGKDSLGQAIDGALGLLDEMPGPSFLFFHTFEVHAPYWTREPHYGRWGPAGDKPAAVTLKRDGFYGHFSGERLDPAVAVAAYDSGIAYMDELLSRLLERIGDNAIVVFTSDHGEALGEQSRAIGHGQLWESNLLVPLVLKLPDGRDAGRRVRTQVRLVDIAPTVLELIGLEHEGLDGASLLPLLAGKGEPPPPALVYAAKRNLGLALRVDNRVKYTFNNSILPRSRGAEALFSLREDPRAERNVVQDHPAAGRLRAELLRQLRAATGLWLRIANSSGAPLEGWIESGPMDPSKVKSPDLDCDCVRIERRGRLTFNLPPERSFHLLLESSGETLSLSAQLAGGAGVEHQVSLEELEGRWALRHAEGRWRETTADSEAAAAATGVEVWWQGRVRPVSEGEPTDPDLVEQLRALGYIN